MKDTKTIKETNEKVMDYLEKILDFAKAISLDAEDMTAECIAITMAIEIQSCSAKALELLSDGGTKTK